jgi:hypothetical protein
MASERLSERRVELERRRSRLAETHFELVERPFELKNPQVVFVQTQVAFVCPRWMFERCPNEDASPHFDLESRLFLFEWPQFENEKALRVGSTRLERAEKAREELFDGVGARAPTSFEIEPTLFELEW